ncbi:hypothetical protein V8E36_000535 [Tilletia maclaganii]
MKQIAANTRKGSLGAAFNDPTTDLKFMHDINGQYLFSLVIRSVLQASCYGPTLNFFRFRILLRRGDATFSVVRERSMRLFVKSARDGRALRHISDFPSNDVTRTPTAIRQDSSPLFVFPSPKLSTLAVSSDKASTASASTPSRRLDLSFSQPSSSTFPPFHSSAASIPFLSAPSAEMAVSPFEPHSLLRHHGIRLNILTTKIKAVFGPPSFGYTRIPILRDAHAQSSDKSRHRSTHTVRISLTHARMFGAAALHSRSHTQPSPSRDRLSGPPTLPSAISSNPAHL